MTGSREIAVAAQDAPIDIDAELPIEPARAAQILLYLIAGLVVLTLLWAAVARIDRVTRGQGRVITSNQLQEIQYLEGGIVKEILVSAGEEVAAGDVLVRLDPTQMNADFTQGREGRDALEAKVARLEAEATMAPLEFSLALTERAPQIVADEKDLYAARASELATTLEIEQSKFDQRKRTADDARVAMQTAKEAATLASQELAMMEKLVAKGIEPQVELLRARQRSASARGELQRAEIAVDRIELEIAEAQGEIDRVRRTFAAAAADELSAAKTELGRLRGELPALEDRVARTDVRAPVDGVVNRVLVSTVGGVVQSGETIIELVPSDDALVVEAKIKPADIGFLYIGQTAKVSISAYDSSIYGSMDGVLETISADAILDEKTGDYFYSVKVRTDAQALASRKGALRILPGMSADVAILGGKRTVLSYLFNPISKVGDRAFTEN